MPHDGHPLGGRQNRRVRGAQWDPPRPADAGHRRRPPKLPAGVHGQPLGSGRSRVQPTGGGGGCLLLIAALIPAVLAAGWILYHLTRTVF